jgi:16S rRNA G1207 methylase RsmC
MKYSYITDFGHFTLKFETQDKSLKPFDAADEYLLSLLADTKYAHQKLLLVNDRCAALSVPLAEQLIGHVNDSLHELEETAENMHENGKPPCPSQSILKPIPDAPDCIVMKIPKSLDHFRFQLQNIRAGIQKETEILAAGMSRYLPASYFECFQAETQDATYSRIEKKARYYKGVLKPQTEMSVQPSSYVWEGRRYISLPGVFSHRGVDPGSGFLLKNMPDLPVPKVIIDPGCGNGILGLEALNLWPEARLTATDENALAVASTLQNSERAGVAERCTVLQTRILRGIAQESADLVLCNPPFHRRHTVSLETGFAFIRESSAVLQEGGYMALVVNKTLGYGNILKENFQKVNILKQNSKYRLILCRK